MKIKNRTLTHYPFIPPQKRRGPILHTMPKTVYNETHINRMHRLKIDTTKILPNNKLKTNFLSDKSKKLTWILKGSSPIQQNLKNFSPKNVKKNIL